MSPESLTLNLQVFPSFLSLFLSERTGTNRSTVSKMSGKKNKNSPVIVLSDPGLNIHSLLGYQNYRAAESVHPLHLTNENIDVLVKGPPVPGVAGKQLHGQGRELVPDGCSWVVFWRLMSCWHGRSSLWEKWVDSERGRPVT